VGFTFEDANAAILMSWDIPIGTEFAGYRILEILGRGGMSVVYTAEHMRLGRMVALKLLTPALAADESFRERFIRESRLAATLDHPNIIPIYDAGEAEGFLYIAMRHVEGSDLGEVLKETGQLPIAQTLFYIEQVAGALDQAHEQGLVHRDVKPANILIAKPSDRVYLTDFGVVKATSSGGLTKTGYFLGTFEYAAPEQIEGKEIDGRTDLYALGCVVYEALSGEPPFKAETEASVIHAHLVDPPPKLTTKRPDLPLPINDVIATAMAKAKEDRFSSAGELVRALRAVALGTSASPQARGAPPTEVAGGTVFAGPQGARPPAPPSDGQGGGAPPTQLPPTAEPAPAAPPPREPRTFTLSGRQLAIGAAVLALLVAGGIAAAILLSSGSGKSTNGSTTTGSGSKTTQKTGFAGVISSDLLKYCTKASPQLGAALTDTCKPTSGLTTFWPDSWTLSLFSSTAAALTAYNSLRNAVNVGQNFGTCSESAWGGEGSWLHTPEIAGKAGKPGGRRFCYFDGNFAVVVWTHEKFGQPTHIDLLASARAGGSDHSSLYFWYQFWHHKLGKCITPGCVARIK
jgi:serine/threonine protein kinase